jgi:FkbM family methyltransferase
VKYLFSRTIQQIASLIYFLLYSSKLIRLNLVDTIYIKLYLLYKSKIESFDLEFLKNYLKGTITVIDVGSNVGYFTISIAKYLDNTSKILSIEPSEQNIIRMKKVLKHRTIVQKIEIVKAGASDSNNVGYLKIDQKNPSNNQISSAKEGCIEIKLLTLDSICSGIGDIGLVKIDVQGYELKVLQGATKLIAEQLPILLIEIDYRISSLLALILWDFLTQHSYLIFLINEKKKILTRQELTSQKGYFDIFCIHKSKYVYG